MRLRPICLKTSALRGASFLSVEPGTRLKHSRVFLRPASPRARRVFLCLNCRADTKNRETLRTLQNVADFGSIFDLIRIEPVGVCALNQTPDPWHDGP